jgi:hypothetical protein
MGLHGDGGAGTLFTVSHFKTQQVHAAITVEDFMKGLPLEKI